MVRPTGAGITTWQVAVGGRDAGGTTVGAGVPLATGVAVGGAVGGAVGVAVGVEVAVAVGVGAVLGVALGVGLVVGVALALGLALADALGLGDASSIDGLTSETSRLPLRSLSVAWSPLRSTFPTPCMSFRNACSWVMMSCGQAIWVPASGPIAASLPLVVYGPW